MAGTSTIVMDAVRAADHDRYLSALYAPADKRDALLALYAFNAEIAGVRDRIHEPLPGEVRLQWWRDILAVTGQADSGHPIADALKLAIDANHLPLAAFENMLEARIFDLYDDPMPSREHFEAYAGETASTLIVLAATILSPSGADRIADAAGHAGVAQTAAGVLRLLPIHRARGQVYLPGDILAAAGCTAPELLAGEVEPSGRAIAAMVAYGREHAAKARALFADVPREVRAAFLPALLAAPYLDRIERAGAGVLRQPPDLSAPRKAFQFWRWMRG